jgi:hypothetical protein
MSKLSDFVISSRPATTVISDAEMRRLAEEASLEYVPAGVSHRVRSQRLPKEVAFLYEDTPQRRYWATCPPNSQFSIYWLNKLEEGDRVIYSPSIMGTGDYLVAYKIQERIPSIEVLAPERIITLPIGSWVSDAYNGCMASISGFESEMKEQYEAFKLQADALFTTKK